MALEHTVNTHQQHLINCLSNLVRALHESLWTDTKFATEENFLVEGTINLKMPALATKKDFLFKKETFALFKSVWAALINAHLNGIKSASIAGLPGNAKPLKLRLFGKQFQTVLNQFERLK